MTLKRKILGVTVVFDSASTGSAYLAVTPFMLLMRRPQPTGAPTH